MLLAPQTLNFFSRYARYVKRFIILLLALFCISFSQHKTDEFAEARTKAQFIYNFVKHIHWPENESYDIFTIGIIGKTLTINELRRICFNKTIKGKSINIIQISETERVDDCQAIFITRTQRFLLDDVLDVVGNNATLIITEAKGMLQEGSTINFVKQGSKDAFEINKEALDKHGLKIPENLLVLAVNIEAGPQF